MPATRNRNGRLEEAMAVLLNTQVAFLERLARSDERLARMDERFARMDERLAERFAAIDERFARIDSELADIKAILLRHEQTLAALPDAIRDKIGFKTR
jgi:chromosome segregation ATPase